MQVFGCKERVKVYLSDTENQWPIYTRILKKIRKCSALSTKDCTGRTATSQAHNDALSAIHPVHQASRLRQMHQ